ncbi:MAG: HIG1 domain-containing protein [Rhodobacteraceae bacterium]|nr:HIG1 domain-containing protein [Paracoccaceae bacterium]
MLQDPLFLLVIAAVTITSLILVTGPGGFARGGEFNRKHTNRIMHYRIAAQAVAIASILPNVWLRRGG